MFSAYFVRMAVVVRGGSFAGILSPPVAQLLMPLQFAGILGEATLTAWLVTRGVDVPRRQDAAASAIPLGRI